MASGEDSLFMNRACQIFIVIGAVVLFIMLLNENMRQTPAYFASPKTSSTCSMRSSANGDDGTSDATSAKRAATKVGTLFGRSNSTAFAEKEESYQNLSEKWMNDEVKGCKGLELKQDEGALKEAFNKWEADEKTDEQFEAHAIDPKKVMKAAGMRAAGTDIGASEPTFAKNGLVSPLLTLWHGKDAAQPIASDWCPSWGANEAYTDYKRRHNIVSCATQSDVEFPSNS